MLALALLNQLIVLIARPKKGASCSLILPRLFVSIRRLSLPVSIVFSNYTFLLSNGGAMRNTIINWAARASMLVTHDYTG